MLAYGKTHYICEEDCAAAIIHLAVQGVQKNDAGIEVYNVCDSLCGVYADIFSRVDLRIKKNKRSIRLHIPALLEVAKDILKYRLISMRYPLGMVDVDNRKLLDSGFIFPLGYDVGLERAIDSYFQAKRDWCRE
jgi:hypothetical protein